MQVLYKIVSRQIWEEAEKLGVFVGAGIDVKDGYIHLSTAAQARETARLHFAGQTDLLLVAVAEASVAQNLKWEPSRGGQLFPHVYGALDPAKVLWAKPCAWNGAAHDFPAEFI